MLLRCAARRAAQINSISLAGQEAASLVFLIVSRAADLFAQAGAAIQTGLADWEIRVDEWCQTYSARHGASEITEINLGDAVFLFDHLYERVTLAYAVSVPQLHARDNARMRGFPDVNVGVRAILGAGAFLADRGHFLGHASGGELDINLFPHRRELNRGWSDDGRRFREMERYVSKHPGCFFYHLPKYDDDTWIPDELTFGVLMPEGRWWEQCFLNKRRPTAS
jgi:hypothetical protein